MHRTGSALPGSRPTTTCCARNLRSTAARSEPSTTGGMIARRGSLRTASSTSSPQVRAGEDGGAQPPHLRHLERYPLRTSYTAIADEVVGIMRSDALNSDEYDPARHRMCKPKVELLVDKTGYLAGILEGKEDADEDEADLLEGDEEVED